MKMNLWKCPVCGNTDFWPASYCSRPFCCGMSMILVTNSWDCGPYLLRVVPLVLS